MSRRIHMSHMHVARRAGTLNCNDCPSPRLLTWQSPYLRRQRCRNRYLPTFRPLSCHVPTSSRSSRRRSSSRRCRHRFLPNCRSRSTYRPRCLFRRRSRLRLPFLRRCRRRCCRRCLHCPSHRHRSCLRCRHCHPCRRCHHPHPCLRCRTSPISSEESACRSDRRASSCVLPVSPGGESATLVDQVPRFRGRSALCRSCDRSAHAGATRVCWDDTM